MKILIVDDSKAVHAFLDRCFGGKAVTTTHVYHGQDAVDHLHAHKDYDLIMLDWEMPVLDGPGTVDALNNAGNQIPILMMTTKNNPEDIMQMLSKGVREYMLKPFTSDILFEKIEMVLGQGVKNAA